MNRLLVVGCLVALVTNRACAEDWPSWRGPTNNGVAAGTGYATSWSATENVAWKVTLPGIGSSTPVVSGDHIFVTCGVNKKNTLLCYNRAGQEQWRVAFGDEIPGKNKKASGSNSSPVTDGKHVFAYFKSGEFAAVDFSGKVAWKHNLQDMYGKDTLWWDLGTSPVLTKDSVVVAVMQTGPSYLAAFDLTTGKVKWKQDRNLDAPEEAAQSYSTPCVLTDNGKEILVVLGADYITAHDASTGSELWRVGGLNPTNHKYFRSIASAVVANGIVVAPYARGNTITAVRLGGSGDARKSHVVWERDDLGADVPTPAAINGKAYVCGDRGTVTCIEIQSGKTVWTGQLEKNKSSYSSSPVLADGKVYVTREDGKVFVLSQDSFQVLGEGMVDELTVSTPVFVDGKILLRTDKTLFCISK